MKKKLAFADIDFNDSSYTSLEMFDEKLIVNLEGWDEKNIRLEFTDPIQFIYKGGDLGADLYLVEGGVFLQEALLHYYVKMPTNHPYKLFQFHDIQDFPFLEIVARDVLAITEK